MRFEFATATRIICGPGTLREVGPLAREFGCRALLVTGQKANRSERLRDILRASAVEVVSFTVAGEPDISMVERGLAIAKPERCELVIGCGGGSVIDAGKAIAGMLTNDGELLDFLEVVGRGRALKRSGAPFIAIPTTAGTGSEVTRNAVLASPEHRVKVSLRSPHLLARVAVVDPELAYDLPPLLTACTGLDALTQLIEPYVSSRANALTDGLCREGLVRVARSLRTVCADGQNTPAREDMAVASLFGGFALANAGLGAVHGFAGPIGGMFPAPHGAVCAALLPSAMSVNLRALTLRAPGSESLKRFEEVARLLTGKPQATAEAGVQWVAKLVSDLGIPRLRAYGLQEKHLAEIVEKAAKASSMKANPILLAPEELSDALQAAL